MAREKKQENSPNLHKNHKNTLFVCDFLEHRLTAKDCLQALGNFEKGRISIVSKLEILMLSQKMLSMKLSFTDSRVHL